MLIVKPETTRVAVAAPVFDLSSVVVTAPIGILLRYDPESSAVTYTSIRQVALAFAIAPFARVITLVPVTAVSVPPQVLVAPVEFVIRIPVGRVSVKAKPVTPISVGEVRVIRSRTLVPGAIGEAEKALLTLTGPPGVTTPKVLDVMSRLLAPSVVVMSPAGIVFV